MKRNIFLSLLLFSFAIVACNENKSGTVDADIVNNPISADNQHKNVKGNLPIMTFDKTSHDFGQIIDGEKVTYSFKFTNTGKGDLIIQTANGSCGCTVPEFPQEPIKPGKSGFIKVQFNSEGRTGIQEKQVTIVSNTIPNMMEVKIRAEVLER